MKSTKRKLDTHRLNYLPVLLSYQTLGQSRCIWGGVGGQTLERVGFSLSLSTYNW